MASDMTGKEIRKGADVGAFFRAPLFFPRLTSDGRLWRLFGLLILCIGMMLTGCASQPPPVSVGEVPGFFMGFLHGFIIVFSLIGSIFTDVRIYAFPNSGFWYDLGFFLGASAFLGGGGAGAKNVRRG